jgi:acetyl-CoA acyltransferase
MNQAVIAGFVRTPFHISRKGRLIDTRPDDMAAVVLRALVDRSGVDPTLFEDVLMGCGYPEGEQSRNIARIATLLAGLPNTLGGATFSRACGSSMTGVHYAVGQIASGMGDAFICAGTESMTRIPMGGFTPSPNPRFMSDARPQAEIMVDAYIAMGRTAENVAAQYKVSRADQDAFALSSQQKAAAAQAAGHFTDELVAMPTTGGLVESDGCPRPQTTLEDLAKLKPAFDAQGTVTAGTSSPLTDGACAVLVCSEAFARTHKLPVLAKVIASAVAGCAPEIMGMGPVPATLKALARAGLKMGDIDVVEINEAFASQALACLRELDVDLARVNIDGGAIALGHPAGATGARLVGKAAQILSRSGGRYALATQCIGGGQGITTILESV